MTNEKRDINLPAIEERLGVSFRDPQLLWQAFVHRSYLNENPAFPLASNERLEFLGDAVLSLVAAELLFRQFPELPEGDLTRFRAALIRGDTLARLARSLGLDKYLLIGRGEEANGGRGRKRTLAAVLESLIGAIFMDRGLQAAGDFATGFLKAELARAELQHGAKDYKSRLQELTQGASQVTPSYRTLAAGGPEHGKTFTVGVFAGERLLATGEGGSKQEAEQAAARQALAGAYAPEEEVESGE